MSLLPSRGGTPIFLFIGFWLFAVALNLSILGAIIYVAYHFISKWW